MREKGKDGDQEGKGIKGRQKQKSKRKRKRHQKAKGKTWIEDFKLGPKPGVECWETKWAFSLEFFAFKYIIVSSTY